MKSFTNYTCCITSKGSTSWRAHLRVIAPMDNTAPFEEMLYRWRVFGNTMSDLTGPRLELQIFRYRDERVTAQPPGRFTTEDRTDK